MKAWLKGGLIGLVVGAISFHQSMLTVNSIFPDFILIILFLPFMLINVFSYNMFVVGIFGICMYVLIGVVIGLIVGKIKQGGKVGNE